MSRVFSIKILFLILLLFMFLFLFALKPAFADDNFDGAIKSLNNFALKSAEFLNQNDNGGSFFFSPYSIISALGMTYAGAADETAKEFENILLFNPEIHAELGELTQVLTANLDGKDDRPLLTSANRIWVKKGLNLQKKFSEILLQNYKSSAARLDFQKRPELAKRIINKWVANRTNQRIQNLLDKIQPDTNIILTNAVYFNGKWADEFNEKLTQEKPFFITPENKINVNMMRRRAKMFYAEDKDIKILNLPYMGRLSMILAMSLKPEDGAEKVINKFSAENGTEIFNNFIKSLSEYDVDLWLPKFKTERRYELKNILKNLGLKSAFEDDANFSAMTSDEPLKIDSVIHQTFIEVDEKKTEAAAATAVTMVRVTATMPRPVPKAEFHADRPFVYFIIDAPTNSILFMGMQNFK